MERMQQDATSSGDGGAIEAELFSGLTAAQREAVAHVDGPLLVLAGPGSGKTTVVTRRVAHLISTGIPPWQILALTFTNKAAGEMRERIDRLVAADLPGRRGLTIATFHSFCVRLLRRYSEAAGLSSRFTIYDAADQKEALKIAMKEAGVDAKNFTPASIAGAISKAKNMLIDAAMFKAQAGDFHARTIGKAFEAYQKTLRRNDALDFDDLLLAAAKLLRNNEAVRTELQRRFQYLMIDEYQDTNYAQFVIAHALASAHRNICVVGDPDQSIYAWRGADIRNILEFEEHYPSPKIVPLGQNFRSTSHIVETAAALIQNNKRRKHKRLYTELGDGAKPSVITCFDEHHEAQLIVERFRALHDMREQPIPWKEMAILYRMNALSRVLEEYFRNAGIPYVIARGTAFYERKEIKDALAYLRLVANPSDEVSLRRVVNVPARGIGATTIEKIEMWALQRQLGLFDALREAGRGGGGPELQARTANAVSRFVQHVESWRAAATGTAFDMFMGQAAPPHVRPQGSAQSTTPPGEKAALAELVERIIKESGMEAMYRSARNDEDLERLENLNELINAAADFAAPPPELGEQPGARPPMTLLEALNAWLEAVTLVSDADAIDPASGAVTLMTLHAAKGLEFDCVAIAGLEEGILPHSRALQSPTDTELEEERRLAFVGITRARKHLLISRAAVRTQRGLPERTIPSQFLHELPAEHIEAIDHAGMVGMEDYDEFDRPFGEPSRGSGNGSGAGAGGGGGAWGRSSYDAGRDWRESRAPRAAPATQRLASMGRSVVEQQFPVGCMVQHPTFGVGRVEIVTARARGSSVQVEFRSVGRKTLIVEFAKLQRVE